MHCATAPFAPSADPNHRPECDSRPEKPRPALNANMNGQFLFAGINTDVKPMAEYEADPPSAPKAALDAAFLAEFGFTQDDPAVAGIDPAQMQTFLDGAYADLFLDNAQWEGSWSDASSRNVRSRIATNELIETSANANEQPFRLLAMTYTAITDLGLGELSRGSSQAVIDKAIGKCQRSDPGADLHQGAAGRFAEPGRRRRRAALHPARHHQPPDRRSGERRSLRNRHPCQTP